jgi:hypothetical protein
MPIKTAPPPDPGAPPIPPPNPPPVPCAVVAQTPIEKIAELEQKKVGATDEQRDTINGEILEQDAKLIGITLPSDVKQRPGKGDL